MIGTITASNERGTTILKINNAIVNLEDKDIEDNLLYYDYNISHLLALERKGFERDSQEFMNAFRSFEGEVYENLIYEKLIRYAKEHEHIEHFVVKGPHKKRTKALSNTLSVNWKGQIVYRTRQKEIGEFDGLIFTKDSLIFVEMTLVGSVTNLRKRLRKKRALLQTIFPQYDIKALLVLNEDVTGTKQLPPYCIVWKTKQFTDTKVYDWISREKKDRRRRRFQRISGKKIVTPEHLDIKPFRYYNTLTWVLKKLRGRKDRLVNMGFFNSEVFTRYHDIFTKVYIGYMDIKDFKTLYPFEKESEATRVYVAIEKEHTGAMILTYFVQHSRKKLDNIRVGEDGIKVVKKDPFGITVTEIVHMNKTMEDTHRLSVKDIRTIEKLMERYNASL